MYDGDFCCDRRVEVKWIGLKAGTAGYLTAGLGVLSPSPVVSDQGSHQAPDSTGSGLHQAKLVLSSWRTRLMVV